jgi:uncharacterized protein
MSIRYLILALTTRCNLNCSYCYNGEASPPLDMSPAVLQAAVELAVEGGGPFHLQLSGGEPTLVPDLIRLAARRASETGRCGQIGLQTNATCLTAEVVDVIKSYEIQVGISLDGPPQVHQHQRGKAAETLRGMHLLEAAEIPFRVTTVVTRASAASLDRLVMLLAGFASARGIGLDLLVDKGCANRPGGAAPADAATLISGLQRMVVALDAINARRRVPLQLRERDLLGRTRPETNKIFCHAAAGESLAVDPEGRLFPCGQTLGDPQFAAGTVWAPQFNGLTALERCQPPTADCRACALESICPGDCPSRLHYNAVSRPAQACVLYQTLWKLDHVNTILSEKGEFAS